MSLQKIVFLHPDAYKGGVTEKAIATALRGIFTTPPLVELKRGERRVTLHYKGDAPDPRTTDSILRALNRKENGPGMRLEYEHFHPESLEARDAGSPVRPPPTSRPPPGQGGNPPKTRRREPRFTGRGYRSL